MFCLHPHMWKHRNKSQSLHSNQQWPPLGGCRPGTWLGEAGRRGTFTQTLSFDCEWIYGEDPLWEDLSCVIHAIKAKLQSKHKCFVRKWEAPRFSWFAHNVSAAVTFTTCPVVPLTHFNMYLYKSHWPSVRWTFYLFINLLFYNIWTESDSHSLAL